MASTSSNIKSKKSLKGSDKKKSQPNISTSESSANDKSSVEKDCKMYGGIGPDIIRNYAEQSMFETHLTDEVCNTLSEDINYKIRYIIHDALLKARLCGRDKISSRDIEETFSNLSIERVYGASTNPNWVPFSDLPGTGTSDQTFYYLDDTPVNLIEIAEEETKYVQYSDIVLVKTWYPDAYSEELNSTLKNYFTIACQSIVGIDDELKEVVLKDISENPKVANIHQWFYHFAYFLLIKNITYDCLTLRALELVEILENSPLSSLNVTVKVLHLLIRLLLQRLLLSYTSPDVLSRMCFTLGILCLREPLRDLTITKINQKLDAVSEDAIHPILTIIYYLGVDAVKKIFLSHITFFMDRVIKENNTEMVYITQAIYGIICKAELDDNYTHNWFDIAIPNELTIYWKPRGGQVIDEEKLETNFVQMKSKLVKTRRKVDYTVNRKAVTPPLEEVFDLPVHNCKLHTVKEYRIGRQTYFTLPTYKCKLLQKLQDYRMGRQIYKKETHITIGKTSLLLSVLNTSNKYKTISKVCDHSLLSYNL